MSTTFAFSDLEITPGRLLKAGERCSFRAARDGALTIGHRRDDGFREEIRVALKAGEPWLWTPLASGSYLASFSSGDRLLQRPLAVVEKDWAVCQITVGAFTAEDFADTIHSAGAAADYYAEAPHDDRVFSVADPQWPRYEAKFGDAIHPHLMANNIGFVDARFDQEDPNWDTLPHEAIVERLRALQAWWQASGYAPLDRIATYTPSNPFVRACEEAGIRVIHSLVPEQNWSDGEWAINHWGMPTCPYWMTGDDFRKPGPRRPRAVLGMTMNHYQVVLPHLTRWGDFVLSPSHFDRWIRAADSGDEPVRFRQFLDDTVRGWRSDADEPFFFVAGFEFGRTFGTRKMTDFNRKGLEALLALGATEKLVFATSRDVLAYYERHVPELPARAFRQRDSWAGVVVNGKPPLLGDSLVVERAAYKAAFREGEALPLFHYDYREPWQYDARDENVPTDHADSARASLAVRRFPDRMELEAAAPLARAVPIAVWDAVPGQDVPPFSALSLPSLEAGRPAAIMEIPAGWRGRCAIPVEPGTFLAPPVPPGWRVQAFQAGRGLADHLYVTLDPLPEREAGFVLHLPRPLRVDGAQGTCGILGPGPVEFAFDLLKPWYRLWDCKAGEVQLPERTVVEIGDAGEAIRLHEEKLATEASRRLGGAGRIAFQVLCGADLPHGTRSRAAAHDRTYPPQSGFEAKEFADGVLALGPGRAFWYHPRTLHFKVTLPAAPAGPVRILLNSFDPFGLDASYAVSAGATKFGSWKLPGTPWHDAAWRELIVPAAVFDAQHRVAVTLATEQKQLLHDWWRERGFIAALHALWVIVEDIPVIGRELL